MNVKFLALAAVAASMTLVGCNKTLTPEETGVPKSVTIKLANVVPGTRSEGSTNLSSGDPVQLNSYQVFFSDGTTLYKAKQANNEDEAEQYFSVSFDGTPLEASFHFLPSSVNKVIVIGNMSKIEDAEKEADLDRALSIAEQQDITNLTLYAESGLTLASDQGHQDEHTPTQVYEADLVLAPQIAGLYVEGFKYNYTGVTSYKKLDMLKIALNNYYNKATLASQALSEPSFTTIDNATVWNWFAGLTPDSWNWDDLTGKSLEVTGDAPQTATLEAGYYYHFFAADGDTPQIVMQCQSNGEPQYIASKNFYSEDSRTTPVEFKNGVLYKMTIEFTDDDLAHPDKCVDISVEPVDWVVTTIYPEF